jgi:hypothetical protein
VPSGLSWETGLHTFKLLDASGTQIGGVDLAVNTGCALAFSILDSSGSQTSGEYLSNGNNGNLKSGITLKVTATTACTHALAVTFSTGTTNVTRSMGTPVGGIYSLGIAKNDYDWDVGAATFSFTYNGSAVVPNPTQIFTVCDSRASHCP